ncbi:uncharacterized protein DAT39_011317 [Clarias magur]|uniref:Uncharacterized protein n=1 Tax=Clarias magur TaxID=1594786 RepID=A0A8J4U3K5_CLAMG|nr:uncharacterized protein DAT39_011317 [Clarias magur]
MDQHCLPYRLLRKKKPAQRKIPSAAPKKTRPKHIDQDLKNRRLNLEERSSDRCSDEMRAALLRGVFRCLDAAPVHLQSFGQ